MNTLRRTTSTLLLLAGAVCSGRAGLDQWRAYSAWRAGVPASDELVVRRLGIRVPVVEGTGQDELSRGAGHLTTSVHWGVPGNAVVAGHRDAAFRPLERIRRGDVIEVGGRYRYRYQVEKTSVILPSDVAMLQPTEDAVLTLITCYPFEYVGPAPKRFIVRARLQKTGFFPSGSNVLAIDLDENRGK